VAKTSNSNLDPAQCEHEWVKIYSRKICYYCGDIYRETTNLED